MGAHRPGGASPSSCTPRRIAIDQHVSCEIRLGIRVPVEAYAAGERRPGLHQEKQAERQPRTTKLAGRPGQIMPDQGQRAVPRDAWPGPAESGLFRRFSDARQRFHRGPELQDCGPSYELDRTTRHGAGRNRMPARTRPCLWAGRPTHGEPEVRAVVRVFRSVLMRLAIRAAQAGALLFLSAFSRVAAN